MKGQKGFSLIELMVVVVIIGILATAGVPQYQKFQMRAKRSEAKSLLSGMYTAQKAFHAEWNQYYANFDAVGYGLDGDLGYTVGFSAAGVTGPATHPTYNVAAGTNINSIAYCAIATNTCRHKSNATAANLGAGHVTAVGTFRFAAGANLDNDARIDVMTINENRQIQQAVNADDLAG